MSQGKVILICSNATEIEVQGGRGKTGHYLNETVIPIWAVMAAGYDVVLATPDGTRPHIDEVSRLPQHFGGDEATFRRAEAFFADDPVMTQVVTLRAVIDEGLENYAAIFVPGGQAPVVDLMQDPDMGEILRHFHAQGKPTALLCHGPIATAAAMPAAREFRAALVAGDTARAAELARGWQYAGYRMTIFTNSEEKVIEDQILHATMYFHVVDALEIAGAKVSRSAVDYEPYLVEDRELITGQNPRSDHLIGAALVRALEKASVAA